MVAAILSFPSWKEVSEDSAMVAITVTQAFLAELMLGILGWATQSGAELLVLFLEVCVRTVLFPASMALAAKLQL